MKTHLITICEDQVKAVLRRKFILLNTYIKGKKSKSNHLSFHLRKLEKEQQIKSKVSRRKEKIKTTAEINKI